jgi:hypothetical protein
VTASLLEIALLVFVVGTALTAAVMRDALASVVAAGSREFSSASKR